MPNSLLVYLFLTPTRLLLGEVLCWEQEACLCHFDELKKLSRMAQKCFVSSKTEITKGLGNIQSHHTTRQIYKTGSAGNMLSGYSQYIVIKPQCGFTYQQK